MCSKILIFTIALMGGWLGGVNAFVENRKFCIHTAPLLLTDLEKRVNLLEGHPHCKILATTLTAKEKESFHSTMCKDHGSGNNDDYHFLKLRNGELTGRGSYHDICNAKTHPLLAWVPYHMVQENYARELNPKDRLLYIGKATDFKLQKTMLCHFRHSDLVTNITSDLFTCIVMIFEDNFYGLDASINVLVELQPIMYEIRNVTYLPWINSTASYKTVVGKTVLNNPSRAVKQIFGSVQYAFVEKLKINTTSIYESSLEKLPLIFENKGAALILDDNGVGGMEVKKQTFVGRNVDAKSSVNVDLIGQWVEHRLQFTADIYEYFGKGIRRFKHEVHNGALSITFIESAEPVYEAPDSSHLTKSTELKQKSERLTADEALNGTDEHVKAEWEDFTDAPLSGSGHPYPGFYPWAVVGALIVGAVLLAAVIGMVRSCSKDDDKHKYQLTNP